MPKATVHCSYEEYAALRQFQDKYSGDFASIESYQKVIVKFLEIWETHGRNPQWDAQQTIRHLLQQNNISIAFLPNLNSLNIAFKEEDKTANFHE